jgi:hypothetical protein
LSAKTKKYLNMCSICTNLQLGILQKITKDTPAIDSLGFRTLTGVVAPGDEELILKQYPIMDLQNLKTYLGFFKAPRLYEVVGPLELVYRMLNGLYSTISTPAVTVEIQTAYNPLSILSKIGNKIVRVKTTESQLLHEGMEKLNLRQYTMQKVNEFFDQLFGLQIRFACSCGVGVVKTADVYSPDFVKFLENREEMGRTFDSDVLTVTGNLFFCEDVSQVPKDIIAGSPDVNQQEIESYIRYYTVVKNIIEANPFQMNYLPEQQKQFFS